MDETRRRSVNLLRVGVFLPIAGLLMALILALIGLTVGLATYQTRVAISEQGKLADGAIASARRQIERTAAQYAALPEAYDRIVVQADRAWAQQWVGAPVHSEWHYESSFLLSSSGSVFYRMDEGRSIAVAEGTPPPLGLDLLLQRAWRSGTGEASGIMRIDGRIAVVALASIRSEGVPLAGSPSLVFVDDLQGKRLASLAERYLLPNLGFDTPNGDSAASIDIATVGGPPARLGWTPARPGDAVLRVILPVLLVLLTVFVVLAVLALRHAALVLEKLRSSEKKAMRDPLTGLPNRLVLFESLARLLAPGRRQPSDIAVLYLDLDGFKRVNDRFGHDVGDAVIKMAAERLSSCLREGDLLVRLGGDEFCILLDRNVTLTTILAIGDRLRAAIAEPMPVGGQSLQIGVTIGVSLSPQDGTEALTLVKRADDALYAAKNRQRGTLAFFSRTDSPSAMAVARAGLRSEVPSDAMESVG